MPITHFLKVYNFLDALATVLETLIHYLQRFYLLFKGGEVQKLWSYFHFQALAIVPVPMTESSTSTSYGDRSWYQ